MFFPFNFKTFLSFSDYCEFTCQYKTVLLIFRDQFFHISALQNFSIIINLNDVRLIQLGALLYINKSKN